MDSVVRQGCITWCMILGSYLTSNCDYLEEVEASCISYLITVALEDSNLMDLKQKLNVALSW